MNNNFVIYIAVMFAVTYLVRVLPLLLIRKKIENVFIKSFLAYIPYTVLAAMTFPAIFHSATEPLSGIVAAAVALVLAFLKQGLCVVAAGAAIAAYIVLLIV